MEQNIIYLHQLIKLLFEDTNLIKNVVEIGARDCNETLIFLDNYPMSNILTFECNPSTLPICRNKVKGKPRIKLIEKAVSDTNSTIKFYPIDKEKTKTAWSDGNPGASSIFKASGKYPIEEYVQKEIEVESVRLENVFEKYMIDKVDLLWMDIQGAELLALKGLGTRLKDIKIIHTEAEFLEIYNEQPLFDDIQKFISNNGFIFVGFTSKHEFACDAVFLNKDYFSDEQISKVTEFLNDLLIEFEKSTNSINHFSLKSTLKKWSKILKK